MFKNAYPYENVPYWTPWRIFCGAYIYAVIMFFAYLLICFLFEADPGLSLVGAENWQIFLITLSPLMLLVASFSLCPYGDG
jgi:hypothetical protein